MGMFSQLPKGVANGATPDSRVPKLTGPTAAHVRIRSIRHSVSRNPGTEDHEQWFVEITLLCSSNDNHPVDSVRTISTRCPPFKEYTPDPGSSAKKKEVNTAIERSIGALKAINAAATGRKVDEVTEEDLNQMTAEPFCLERKELIVEVSDPIAPKNPNGKPWYRYEYYPATEAEISRIQRLANAGPATKSHGGFDPAPESAELPDD